MKDAMEEKKMNKDVKKRRKVSIGWNQVEIVFQNSIFVNAFIVYCHGSFVVATASHHVAVFVSLNASLKLMHRSIKSGWVGFSLSGMDTFICSSSELMTV